MTNAEARARMDRAFTMPQFVTSSAGYGGSARAKKVGAAAEPPVGARLTDGVRGTPGSQVSVCL